VDDHTVADHDGVYIGGADEFREDALGDFDGNGPVDYWSAGTVWLIDVDDSDELGPAAPACDTSCSLSAVGE
jgi:hypothetical protein